MKASLEQLESTSSEASITDENPSLIADDEPFLLPTDPMNSNHSRDDFVKLLEKQAYVRKSPSPSNISNHHPQSYDRRNSLKHSYTYRGHTRPLNKKPQ